MYPRCTGLCSPILLATFLGMGSALAEPLTDRTPNLEGVWVPEPWFLYFDFNHRFQVTAPPALAVSNSPTLQLGFGLPLNAALEVHYASSSAVVQHVDPSANDNELEVALKERFLSEAVGDPLGMALVVAWNTSITSLDAELTLARSLGPVRWLVVGRGYSDGFGMTRPLGDVATGVTVEATRYLALGGDVGYVVGAAGEAPVWAYSGGVQFAIPFTPHTVSFHASNARSTTRQGAAYGDRRPWWGFAFTIQFGGLDRWRAIFAPPPEEERPAEAGVVEVDMRHLSYQPSEVRIQPGQTVRWVNRDDVVHTVTEADHAWDSGDLPPGASWSRTFDRVGTEAYYCTLHPFMKGNVVVETAKGE